MVAFLRVNFLAIAILLLFLCLVALKSFELKAEFLVDSVNTIAVKSTPTSNSTNETSTTFPNGSLPILSPIARNATNQSKIGCCYHSDVSLMGKFTREFLDHQKALDNHGIWTGDEYEEWIKYSYETPFGQVLNDLNTSAYMNQTPLGQVLNDLNTSMCEFQWQRLVLAEQTGWRLAIELHHITHTLGAAVNVGFRYIDDDPTKQRVLLLGDSIAQGIWINTQTFFGHLANIHSAPTNCGGFAQYEQRLDQWLGSCPWHLIHWNIGMHFPVPDGVEAAVRNHGAIDAQDPAVISRLEEYKEGLVMVIRRLREHSPQATLAFSLTTPSPLDAIQKEDLPDFTTCPHYNLFHPRGYVSILNKVAEEVCKEHNVTLIDRYSVVLPSLGHYQKPCDVHFVEEGYQQLARTDWETLSKLLGLPAS